MIMKRAPRPPGPSCGEHELAGLVGLACGTAAELVKPDRELGDKSARLLARPEFLLRLRLSPGDCLIFDNTRVLHARTALAATGERHLQGCYADLDGLLSTLAVLRRRQ